MCKDERPDLSIVECCECCDGVPSHEPEPEAPSLADSYNPPVVEVNAGFPPRLVLVIGLDGHVQEMVQSPENELMATRSVESAFVHFAAWNLALQRRIEQLEWAAEQPVNNLDWDNPLLKQQLLDMLGIVQVDCISPSATIDPNLDL